MATIYKRSNRWHALIRRKGLKTTDKSFTTRREAAIWSRDIESKLDRGLVEDITRAHRVTMASLFARYEQEVSPSKRNSRCESYMLKMLKDRLGHLPLAKLTRSSVAKFRDARIAEGKSASTVRNNLHLLSAVIAIAINDWSFELPYNPVHRISKSHVDNARDRRLELGEEQRLLKVTEEARNPMIRPLITLALETAMRLGELLSLEWENIDIERREAYLPNTKNGKPRRVPLSSVAITALNEVKHSTLEKRVFYW